MGTFDLGVWKIFAIKVAKMVEQRARISCVDIQKFQCYGVLGEMWLLLTAKSFRANIQHVRNYN